MGRCGSDLHGDRDFKMEGGPGKRIVVIKLYGLESKLIAIVTGFSRGIAQMEVNSLCVLYVLVGTLGIKLLNTFRLVLQVYTA